MGKYSNAFKLEAIKLSDEIGVKKATAQLGLAKQQQAQDSAGRAVK